MQKIVAWLRLDAADPDFTSEAGACELTAAEAQALNTRLIHRQNDRAGYDVDGWTRKGRGPGPTHLCRGCAVELRCDGPPCPVCGCDLVTREWTDSGDPLPDSPAAVAAELAAQARGDDQ